MTRGGLFSESEGEGCMPRGWGCLSVHDIVARQTPNGHTNTCENITFPQLRFRGVNIEKD